MANVNVEMLCTLTRFLCSFDGPINEELEVIEHPSL
jgi:hypothetical protein